MGKNMKKVLSYALGICLALGVGFSYAYAVGANDSNAFVTKTEWNAKVAQLEAALDNVKKTMNDSTMDFMLNGPRLRVSLVEGFENNGGMGGGGFPGDMTYRDSILASVTSKYIRTNHLFLMDNWDGSQGISSYDFSTGDNIGGTQFGIFARFALKADNIPDTYIIVSLYYPAYTLTNNMCYMGWFNRITLKDGAQDYSSAQSITVKLPLSEWALPWGTGAISAQGSTSASVYTGKQSDTVFAKTRIYTSNNSAEALSNPGTGYIRRDVTATDVSFTWDFPATACTMKQFNTSSPYCVFNVLPLNMRGRKFGNGSDELNLANNNYATGIVKVYSPQKGCLALKSFLAGEIPILNE